MPIFVHTYSDYPFVHEFPSLWTSRKIKEWQKCWDPGQKLNVAIIAHGDERPLATVEVFKWEAGFGPISVSYRLTSSPNTFFLIASFGMQHWQPPLSGHQRLWYFSEYKGHYYNWDNINF